MNNIIKKGFEGSEIRSVQIDGEPWYVAKDVCRVLDLGNPRQVLSVLGEDQKGVQIMDTLGGPQKINIINKSGALTLALRSRKPEAKKFQRWITDDVVPEIEATGRYVHPNLKTNDADLANPIKVAEMFQLAALTILKLEEEKAAMTPTFEFGNELKATSNLFTATEVAKELGTTATALNRFLHDKKVIFKHRGCWVPYSGYDCCDYFKKVNTHIVKTETGESFQRHSLKITAKGQEMIHALWREHKRELFQAKPLELQLGTV